MNIIMFFDISHKFDLRLRIIYHNLTTTLKNSQELSRTLKNSQELSITLKNSQELIMPLSHTIQTYTDYYAQADVVRADRNWEQGKEDELFVATDDKKVFLPGTVKGKPAFEDGVLQSLGQPSYKTWRRNGGTMIAQSKNWTAIIPGGFRGGVTPNKMNPISFDIGGYSALMGLVHVIVIPNQRITNCVTVMDKDVPLIMEGVQLLETAFNILVEGGADEIGSVRWQLSQSGSVAMSDGSEKQCQVHENDFIDECQGDFRRLLVDTQTMIDDMKMEVTFHADAMSSIRKLHIHGFTADYKTTAYKAMEDKAQAEHGKPKNTSLDEVLYMAQSGKGQAIRDTALSDRPSTPPPVSQRPMSPTWGGDTTLTRQSTVISRQASVGRN